MQIVFGSKNFANDILYYQRSVDFDKSINVILQLFYSLWSSPQQGLLLTSLVKNILSFLLLIAIEMSSVAQLI